MEQLNMIGDKVPELRPVPFEVVCRCGAKLPKGSTARFVSAFRSWDCVACRPRDHKNHRYIAAAVRNRSYYRMMDNVELINQVNEGDKGPELCWVLRERLEDLLIAEKEQEESDLKELMKEAGYA